MKIQSVFVRKRGNKYHAFVEFYDNDGKRKQKSYGSYNFKRDATKKVTEIKNSIYQDTFIAPNDITFTDRCYKYYETKTNEQSPKTYEISAYVIQHYIEPYFKSLKLEDLSIAKYQDFMNYLGNQGYSYNTIRKIYQVSNAVLRECYRLQEINTNIPDFITKPKKREENKSEDVYNLQEIKIILNTLEKDLTTVKLVKIPIYLFLTAGLRFGEIAGLCWEDIDFENCVLNIKHNLVTVKGKFIMKDTKTESSERSIVIPEAVINILKEEKLRQNKLKLQGLLNENEYNVVCLTSKYKYISTSNFNVNYKRFIKKCNLRYIRPHSLRHAHATLLLASGTDIKTVSERLGHSGIEITMDIYTHVLKELDKKASDNIASLILNNSI